MATPGRPPLNTTRISAIFFRSQIDLSDAVHEPESPKTQIPHVNTPATTRRRRGHAHGHRPPTPVTTTVLSVRRIIERFLFVVVLEWPPRVRIRLLLLGVVFMVMLQMVLLLLLLLLSLQ